MQVHMNWTLFHCVFRPCSKRRGTVFLLRAGFIYGLYRLTWYSCIFTACIWALPLAEVLHYSTLNAVKLHNGIMFDFYSQLPCRKWSFSLNPVISEYLWIFRILQNLTGVWTYSLPVRGNGLIELIVCVCVGEVQVCFPICNNTVYKSSG